MRLVLDRIAHFEAVARAERPPEPGKGRLGGASVAVAPSHPRAAAALAGSTGAAGPAPKSLGTMSVATWPRSGQAATATAGDGVHDGSVRARGKAVDLKDAGFKMLSPAEMAKCAKTLHDCGNSWDRVRKDVRSPDMEAMIAYRKQVVNGLIEELRSPALPASERLSFKASSVGSNALSSDYDITFASPGTDHDISAMRKFNQAIEKSFGAQPGIVFDTNIYVQDYVRVSEKIHPAMDRDIDNTPFKPGFVFEASTQSDQQVMSLMKMRRTMDDAAWAGFTRQAVAAAPDAQCRTVLAQQYSQADALVTLADAKLVNKLRDGATAPSRASTAALEKGLSARDRALIDSQVEALGAGTSGGSLTAAGLQDLEAKRANLRDLLVFQLSLGSSIEATDAKTLMAARNEIYADLAGEVRQVEAKLAEAATRSEADGATQADKDLTASLHAQRSQLTGLSIYFAAEAYHSAGAVRHVVAGLQSGGDAKLSLSDLQTSFMEQAGDARMHSHHGKDAADTAFKASKYMTRMLDALQRIQDQTPQNDVAVSAAKDALGGLFGGGRDRLPAKPSDIALLMKHTLLGCKKGEVEVKPEDGKALQAIFAEHPTLVPVTPGGLREAIAASADGWTPTKAKQVMLLPGYAGALADGADLAGRMFALAPGEDLLDRITIVAARFDAAMTAAMPAVDREEERRYFAGRVRFDPPSPSAEAAARATV